VRRYRSVYSVALSAWWCCPNCDAVRFCCPGCGEPLGVRRPPDQPPALPFRVGIECPDPECVACLCLTVAGYEPNPTGDAPANRSPLSDPLPVAERPEPAHRPSPAQRRGQLVNFFDDEPEPPRPRPKRPAPPPKPAPCPAGTPRFRLAAWDANGWLPDGVAPSAIAAAYRRRFGAEPRRDPACKTFRAYSLRELEMVLAELGLGVEP